MFSRRLPASLEENRISRALASARARGSLLDLTETNPTQVGLRYPEAEILSALAAPEALVYEPDPRGLREARRAVAEHYRRRGVSVDSDWPERLFLTASTSESYSLLFQILCDPGDLVLVPEPSYPLFELLARLCAVEVAPYPLRYHAGWYLDVEEVARAVEPRTRAVVVVHPNNPTGSFLKRGELEPLERLCEERGLAIISDEVFADYAYAPDPERVGTLASGERRALTFCLSGLSKPCALPQLKLGWMLVSGPEPLAREAAARLELAADTYLSVGTPVQAAAPRLLPLADDLGAQLLARVRENRARLAERVSGTSLKLLEAEGGWAAILRVPRTRTEEEWVLALLDDGVVVHPGFFFDLPEEAYLVLSLIVPPATFDEATLRLIARVQSGL